jgi:hypothetical protein
MKMRPICKPLLAIFTLALPLLAGALRLEVSDVGANPEAKLKHGVLVVRTTACHEPEKTTISATAEGIVDGARKSIPLRMIPLATAGTFAVTREWPGQGVWAIKVTATNPEYKSYATGLVVPVEKDSPRLAAVQHYSHPATDSDVAAALGNESVTARASIN